MKLVRDDAARWLPSRHRFALTRLLAYFISLRRRPSARRVLLVVDRDQSQLESYALSILYLALATSYVAAFLRPAAMVLALPIAAALIEVPMYLVGFCVPRRDARVDVASFVLMALMVLASAWMATRASWARVPAWAFLALCGCNAIASMVLFAMRRRVAELERRCGA
jgi:hypothetical protein